VKSIRYRGTLYKSALAMFVVIFLVLGYLGTESTTVWGQFGFDAFFLDTKDVATWVARVCTVLYFAFFFLMPWYTARDKVLPVPERVTS
jgi:ubiquinol-cytochrome c reductase cytochrome b subunit